MGDPEVVGTQAPAEHLEKYFGALDHYAVAMLDECRHWLGGARFLKDLKYDSMTLSS
jgi:hypothetical protein